MAEELKKSKTGRSVSTAVPKDSPMATPESNGVWKAEGTVTLRRRFKKAPKLVKVQLFSNAILIHKVSKSTSSNKKKKVVKAEQVPLQLCWLNANPELSDWDAAAPVGELKSGQAAGKAEEKEYFFSLIGPEDSFLISVKSEREKQDWVVVISDSLKAFGSNITQPDVRKGKFSFSQSTSYDGEWLRGKVHGRGTYTAADGTTFSGDWNSQLGAGFGEIKPGNGSEPHEGGWEYSLPGGSVKEVKSDVFTPDEGSLTERDIKLLLQGAVVRTFKKGEAIKNEGDVNESLYRIKSGTVSLQKNLDGQRKILAEMNTDQMFGEMSILDKNIMSATVIAETPVVELECIELTHLYDLFKSEPGLSKRFHKMMARTLAQRLSKIVPKREEKESASASEKVQRPAVRATFSGLLMTGPQGGKADAKAETPRELKFARVFLKAWAADSKLTNFFTDDVVYRDPFVPMGLQGKSALAKHRVSQRQTMKRWEWDDVELFPVPEGFTMRAKVHLTLSSGVSVSDHSLTLIIMNPEGDKIRRMEVYFDKSALKKSEDQSSASASASSASSSTSGAISDQNDDDNDENTTSGSSALDAPIKRRAKDIKFAKRFDLPDDESIIKEYSSVYSDVNGKIYISNNYACFYSRVFGLRTKEAIPLKSVKNIRKKGSDALILRMHRKGKSILGGTEVKHQFVFTSTHDTDEAYALLSQLLHRLESGEAISLADAEKDAQFQNESYIQKFVRQSNAHTHLPEIKVKFLAIDKAVRLIAPRKDETASVLEDDSCVRTISTYPHLSIQMPDGSAQVDKNTRQGDPICDQVCFERYENGALVAVADGCNWGEKPRKAAYLASRTFVEYVKRCAAEVLTVQDAGQLFFQAFVQAHHRIVEGFEDKWWECGTTTLLAGALVQLKDPYNPWGFVCASVGDCKAFVITRRKGVFDITSGSRTGSAATDATDSGGRLGPHIEGNPDLRNLSLYFRLVDEGDIVLLCSDGLYDNLDPQSLGIQPKDLGLEDLAWSAVPPEVVEKTKSDYMCEKIRSLLFGATRSISSLAEDEPPADLELNPSTIVEILINHARDTTQSSREFMEKFPSQKLPTDYAKYPGKMDHTTACAFKVKTSQFRTVEHDLDNLVIRMRHPVKGLHSVFQKFFSPDANKDALQLALQGQGQTGVLTQVNSARAATDQPKPAPSPAMTGSGDKHPLRRIETSSSQALLSDFRGALLTKWLEDNETKDPEQIAYLTQCLINFRYIRPVDLESFKTESFSNETLYQFRLYEPIMTRRDWEAILQGSRVVTYKKDDPVVIEKLTQHQRLYYIISGTCRIEKAVEQHGIASSATQAAPSPKVGNKDDEEKFHSAPSKRQLQLSQNGSKLLLGHMYESETFGEISFLFGGRASASVIADSEEVKLYLIEGRFLDVLFVKYPSLAGRFYHYLASVLAHRLKKQEAKKYEPSV